MSAKNSLLQNVEPQNDRNTNYLPLNVLDAKLSGGNFARITSWIFSLFIVVWKNENEFYFEVSITSDQFYLLPPHGTYVRASLVQTIVMLKWNRVWICKIF
jgi:hypothetical protein